jgi:hypothetical protein
MGEWVCEREESERAGFNSQSEMEEKIRQKFQGGVYRGYQRVSNG